MPFSNNLIMEEFVVKRVVSIVLAVSCIFMFTLLAACSGKGAGESSETTAKVSSATTTEAVTEAKAEAVELEFANYLNTWGEQMKKLEEIVPVDLPNIKIKSNAIGEYVKIMQTRFASGDIPDVFMSGPYVGIEEHAQFSEDLSGEPYWSNISRATFSGIEVDGKKYAVPVWFQGFGIIYNKDLFAKAGITKVPETITEMRAACEAFKSAGITPFSLSFKDVNGQISGFMYGMEENCKQIIDDLADHKTTPKDVPMISKIFDGIQVMVDYSQPKPFDADWTKSVVDFAEGKAAMTINGDWAYDTIIKTTPDIKLGLMGIPASEDPKDCKIYTAPGVNVLVGKGKHVTESKQFVNWLVTAPAAKDWWGKDMKIMTAAIDAIAPNDLAVDLAKATAEGKAGLWGAYMFPTGLQALVEPIPAKFMAKKITKEQAIEELTQAFASFTRQ